MRALDEEPGDAFLPFDHILRLARPELEETGQFGLQRLELFHISRRYRGGFFGARGARCSGRMRRNGPRGQRLRQRGCHVRGRGIQRMNSIVVQLMAPSQQAGAQTHVLTAQRDEAALQILHAPVQNRAVAN